MEKEKENKYLENQILETAHKAISESIVNSLVGYNKPLSTLCENVISDNQQNLYTLINDEFAGLLSNERFKTSLKEALNKKLAVTLINRMGGELEKQVNALKQNPETRAKIMLAISEIVTPKS